LESKDQLSLFLSSFAAIKGKKILVHGGGKLATQLAEKLQIKTQLIEGRRITDDKTLDVITMVYGGLINKKIVAALQKNNCNAIGISGADANIIKAHKRPVKNIDYGFVGDVDIVNKETLSLFLENNITPVLCSITHDKNGQLLNTNADTIASEIAIALSETHITTIYFCFEKNGVLKDVNNEKSVITHIKKATYNQLLKDGIIAKGMLPKLHNSFFALENGVSKVCIGNEEMITNKEQLFTLLTL